MASYADYSRYRDIAVKRLQRLSGKGLAPDISIPTVKELRGRNINPESAIRIIQKFVNAPTTVREFKKLGSAERVSTLLSARNVLAEEKRKAKHREASKRYRDTLKELTPRQRGYIKSAHTLGLKNIKNVRAYVEYIEMRFAQNAEQKPYPMDIYVEDYNNLINKADYNPDDIINDYNQFLADREKMIEASKITDGITNEDGDKLFAEFVKMKIGE